MIRLIAGLLDKYRRMPDMRLMAHIAAVLLFGLAATLVSRAQEAPASPSEENSARGVVEKLIQESGGDVSVAFRSLDGTQELFIKSGRQYEDTLAMKIPIMIELYAEVEAGNLRWSDVLPVHANFRRFGDRTTYVLDLSGDSDVARNVGKTMTLRDLCDAMMKDDSDLAANLLVEKLGIDAIRQRLHAIGADGMVYAAGFGDTEAASKGLRNLTSARALMVVLWALQENRAASAESCSQMIGLIADSGLAGGTPGLTPARPGKPRATPAPDHHEATIIVGARSFVLVTDVRGLSDEQAEAALVARISHAISDAM
jgi:beta-lactamase class A